MSFIIPFCRVSKSIMTPYITHTREEETLKAKTRWFRSLSLAERMDYLCAITDLILENNPKVRDAKNARPTAQRVRIL